MLESEPKKNMMWKNEIHARLHTHIHTETDTGGKIMCKVCAQYKILGFKSLAIHVNVFFTVASDGPSFGIRSLISHMRKVDVKNFERVKQLEKPLTIEFVYVQILHEEILRPQIGYTLHITCMPANVCFRTYSCYVCVWCVYPCVRVCCKIFRPHYDEAIKKRVNCLLDEKTSEMWEWRYGRQQRGLYEVKGNRWRLEMPEG